MATDDPTLPFRKKASCFISYGLFRAVETLARMLPIQWCFRFGQLMGQAAYFLFPRYRTLATRNLEKAYCPGKSPQEIKALARQHFKHLGGNLLSSMKIPFMHADKVLEHVEMVGLEHARQATADGRGLIFALMHMGNWEILSQIEKFTGGAKPAAMYMRLSNPYLNAHVLRLRGRTGCRMFERKDGFFGPVKWLRENGAMGILVDQHAGDGGVWGPLFNRMASTTNLAQLLSKKTGAPILPVGVSVIGCARWRLEISAPIERTADIAEGVAVMNRALETAINTSPPDWFWVHNRWKTPHPNFLLANYKRTSHFSQERHMNTMKPFEILIRSTNWLGDACMSVPAVRAIKWGRPDARVTLLTPAKLGDFWRAVAEVDAVVEIPGKSGTGKVARLIRQTNISYDVAVLFPNSLRTALEVRRAGIPRIVGYKGHWRRMLINQIIPPTKRIGPPEHHVRHYLRIALRLGADIQDPRLLAPITPPTSQPPGLSLRLGLVPGAEYGPAKRWPVENFAAAASALAAETGCEIVIFGAAGDVPLARELEAQLNGKCLNLAGRTNLTQLMHQLQSCRVVLTNDTGAMHLAAALGVPTVSVFGSTEPAWTGPLGQGHVVLRRHVECSPCFLRECPLDFRCMKELSADRAIQALRLRLVKEIPQI